ncbi:MAG: isoamylase early set domain-containing protein [Candidatus Krumholzibacteriales bacterium]
MLREQVISFLQSGRPLEQLPASHPLYPLKETPCLALVSYILMRDDPGMLERFYPKILPHVMERFSSEKTTRSGLLIGSTGDNETSEVYLSPYLNGLANIEIHALYLIASRIGLHARALGYLQWSRELTETISRTFYNYNRDYYFPLDRTGHFLLVSRVQQLIPLVMNRKLDSGSIMNILDNALTAREFDRYTGSRDLYRSSLFHYRLINSLMTENSCPEISPALERIRGSASPSSGDLDAPSHLYLAEAFEPGIGPGLFPDDWATIGSLLHLVSVYEKEDLYPNDRIASLTGDVIDLRSDLFNSCPGLEVFREGIVQVNRLLISLSDINSYFKAPGKLWKVVDEVKWRELSPRDRDLLKKAAESSVQELLDAKALLSQKLASDAGIEFDINLPPSSVPAGGIIDFKASLQSSDTTLVISDIYLQIDRNRWEAGKDARIGPGVGGFSFSSSFAIPPDWQPGMVDLPGYITFKSGGHRYEIHGGSSMTLNEGYQAILNFPEGKKIKPELPVDIVLKYSADQPLQGIVEGRFCPPLSVSPSLPARFRVEPHKITTTLPLILKTGGIIPPGKYPFTLNLYLEGRQIASLEESVVNPLNWLHLGPLPSDAVTTENGSGYQDDFSKSYRSADGNKVWWRQVPSGAMSESGYLYLNRLETEKSSSCLLYTMLEAGHDSEAKLRLDTGNRAILWLNGNIIFSGSGSENAEIAEELREGKNSILLALFWDKAPDPVIFRISDRSGLPITELSNRLDEIIYRYAAIRSPEAPEEFTAGDNEPKEVTLVLNREECSEVSVIGSFNNWDPEATPMKRNGSGIWEATVILEPGKYSYKFLIDNRLKITDPLSEQQENDGFGGTNSVIIVR